MKEILIIPDPHDRPGTSKDRFEWAAKLALDRQPDTIVCLGDWPTMDSLSSYDDGTVFAEGRRYSDDIESHLESLSRFHEPLDAFNRRHSLWKKKQYKPRLVYCYGNHDARITKAISSDPKLIGTMSLDDLQFKEHGWETYDLTVPADVHGIAFGHYFTSGIMGKAIGGVHHAHSLIVKGLNSTVVGHSHLRDFHEMSDVFGNQIFGLVAGCYYDHSDHYTTEGKRMWRGLVYLNVTESETNPEFISIEKVKEEYS